jgi:predicted DsbA family dithiol-disulfide isomerase
MTIEIWSDYVCPFCYIGKRRLERALKGFDSKTPIEIIWRSYELDPEANPQPGQSTYESLSERKGWSVEQTKQIAKQVSDKALAEEGLQYNFDIAVPANTYQAHRLSHLARQYNAQHNIEERLLSAYFVEGKNLNDLHTLTEIGLAEGIPADAIQAMFESDAFGFDVKQEAAEAHALGGRGVPFFVFNRRYGIYGAEPLEVFERTLREAND